MGDEQKTYFHNRLIGGYSSLIFIIRSVVEKSRLHKFPKSGPKIHKIYFILFIIFYCIVSFFFFFQTHPKLSQNKFIFRIIHMKKFIKNTCWVIRNTTCTYVSPPLPPTIYSIIVPPPHFGPLFRISGGVTLREKMSFIFLYWESKSKNRFSLFLFLLFDSHILFFTFRFSLFIFYFSILTFYFLLFDSHFLFLLFDFHFQKQKVWIEK